MLQTGTDDVPMEDYASSDEVDKPAILLIDDNTELLFVMKEMFRERYTVLTAADGQQAWDKLKNNEVDVVICDVMLPDANGWELCARMKGDLRFNHIPVIILTAKNGIEDRVTSYEAGADGYIAKPFELKILLPGWITLSDLRRCVRRLSVRRRTWIWKVWPIPRRISSSCNPL